MTETAETAETVVAEAPEEAPELHVLEEGERLSRSLLWRLQRAFFAGQGIEAWRQGVVPHYITSNAFIADEYARVVAAYLVDRQATRPDPTRPIHIIELGAGSGRFSWLFLRRLTALVDRMPRPVPWRLVMTDLAERNVEFWRTHPALQPYVQRGVLDFGRFDVGHDREVALVASGETLGAAALAHGLVVIANYFFDGIPLDVFAIDGGQLRECLVTVSSTRPEPDLTDPEVLPRVSLTFVQEPADVDGYYDDEAFNAILRHYQESLANTAVQFPVAALRCCKLLRELAGGRMLMLSSDKGYVRDEDLLERSEPGIAVHGSFSISVDYHAIARWFTDAGGVAMVPRQGHESLLTCGFLLGEHPDGHRATRQAFEDTIGRVTPDDFFNVGQLAEQHLEGASVPQMLAVVRMGLGDPRLLSKCLGPLGEQAGAASAMAKREIFHAVEQAWDLYFHLGEDDDLPFEIGRLLYRMDYYHEGLEYFRRSLVLYGQNPHTLFNMALCHYYLQQREASLTCARQVLAMQPNHQGARALRIELEAWAR